MALITPVMNDVSSLAQEWWRLTVQSAEQTYMEWLRATPLARLRLKPQVIEMAGSGRVEQRAVSMLLAAMPDSVSRDMVSGRCLTAVNMLFRLYTMYQPGGAAERNFLLRQLTDLKVGASPSDILSSVKTWR